MYFGTPKKCPQKLIYDRFILEFNQSLVVLHTKRSMFGKFSGTCLELVSRFVRRTFYIGSFEGHIHFSTSWHTKMTLAPNELI